MRLLWQTYRKPDGTRIAYNWCYLVSKINALSLLTGKELTDREFFSFLSYFEWLGHNPKHWKMHTASINEVLDWWKLYKWDDIEVSEIKLFSTQFRVNVFRKVPMVVSINIWDQFELDREDGTLEDTVFDDKGKTWHAIVIHWWNFRDSRRDQKQYSFTRKYIETVWWLFGSQKVLVFKKK